jgi:hypothetical protein
VILNQFSSGNRPCVEVSLESQNYKNVIFLLSTGYLVSVWHSDEKDSSFMWQRNDLKSVKVLKVREPICGSTEIYVVITHDYRVPTQEIGS